MDQFDKDREKFFLDRLLIVIRKLIRIEQELKNGDVEFDIAIQNVGVGLAALKDAFKEYECFVGLLSKRSEDEKKNG